MKRNFSAVLYGKHDLRLEENDINAPGDNEVLLRIHMCGICHTDMSWLQDGVDPQFVSLPLVMGHEASGVVEAIGPGVNNVKPGDRVAIELGIPCRKCELCKSGKYNLCKPWSYGGLQRYLLQPADFLHKIPDEMTFEEAALLEPLSVGVRAVKRAGISVGDAVLVCAAGTLGLCTVLSSKAAGARVICVTDIDEWRLNMALKMGATHKVLVRKEDTGRDVADKIISLLGCQVDRSVECSGVESSLQAAIYATKSGGVMSPVALDPAQVVLPLVNAATREIDIKGVFSYCNDYPAAIAVVTRSNTSPSVMVTHSKPLEELQDAIELVKSKKPGVLKVMVNCLKQ